MKLRTYSLKGKNKEDLVLPKSFEVEVSNDLLNQAIRVYEDGTHFGLSQVKTRSEVNLTKKKLYKQKGTGGARHGAKSAHIFVGGGVSHGPTGLKRILKLSQKMKKVALKMSLSKRFKSNDFVIMEDVSKISKTQEANKIIEIVKKDLSLKYKVAVVLSKENMKVKKYFRNIKDCLVIEFESLNAFQVLMSKLMIFDSSCFEKEVSKIKTVVKKDKKK